MILGAALILGALSLFIYNQAEAEMAKQKTMELLPQLIDEIENKKEAAAETGQTVSEFSENLGVPIELLDPSLFEMTEVEIKGEAYIGYLSIPSLELELPVMADWSYKRLRSAPCRYAGSVRGEDLVIMAHNYAGHFGRLSALSEGDSVLFTDVDGVLTQYEVVGLDVLNHYAVEEMTSGDFDLTLFTCTYGGKSRVTVYCDRVKNG